MMFEKFSGSARLVVTAARQAAEEAGDGEIDGTDLLVALLRTEDETTERLLADHGLVPDEVAEDLKRARLRGGITDADAAALSTLGVDVDQVMRTIEETLGQDVLATPRRKRHFFEPKGHLRFSAEARQTLIQCLREAIRRNHKEIGTEHLLLALLSRKSLAADALTSRGVTYEGVAARLPHAS
jgi:ATP-dependent Clp protease ATP-binding subunit ClpA